MSQQPAFFPLVGGLDMITPAIVMPPGKALAALNYEPCATGYRRIDGYERFDGHPSPTDAYDAVIDGGGTVVAAVAARTAARALIAAVPGEGPVRGVHAYAGTKYAFRDNVGATEGRMYKSTAAGWVRVNFGKSIAFTSGGVYVIAEGNTITGAGSGATAVVQRVIVTSGSWAAGTAAGTLVLSAQTGNFAAENLNVGANLNVATVAGNSAAVTLPPGGRYFFENHNFYANASSLRMYGCNGVGRAFEFDGTTLSPVVANPDSSVDKPVRLAVHKNALMLAYPGGFSDVSVVGEPLVFNGILNAVEFSIGDDIVDYIRDVQGATVILGKNSVAVWYGNDSTDYQLVTLSSEAGALAFTGDKVGEAIYMDNRGLRKLSATQAYGNFLIGTLTQSVFPLLQDLRRRGTDPVASIRVRGKDSYRVFFSDFSGLSIYMGKKAPEVLPFNLGKLVTSICSVETDGVEEMFFGSDDGFVYQLDKGWSFDGDEMRYFLRLPFTHQGGPQVRKRYHKVIIEADTIPEASLYASCDFDYGDPQQNSLVAIDLITTGGGGFWDVSEWGRFYWGAAVEGTAEAYIDGVGKNMSLLIGGAATDEPPHILHGVTLFFSARGMAR